MEEFLGQEISYPKRFTPSSKLKLIEEKERDFL